MSIREESQSGSKTYLGDLLVRRGKIRSYQLRFILRLQQAYKTISRPIRLGELLLAHRAIPQQCLQDALALQQAYVHNGDLSRILNTQEELTNTLKR